MFNFGLFYNVLGDVIKDGFGDFWFFCKRAQNFQFTVSFIFLLFYAFNEIADIVDIVSEENTGKERDDDDEKCLCGIIGMKVTETDCQDDGSSEIIAPDVLLKPLQLVNICWSHPIIIGIEESDSDESARQ